MSNILTIGYTTEGVTDERFLRVILLKMFEEMAFKCESAIEVFEPTFIKFPKVGSFITDAVTVATKAFDIGINVLCIHVDSDANSSADVIKYKIIPAIDAINKVSKDSICKNIVAVIPVYMTEAWMLIDKDLFKEEIGTTKSNVDLGIDKHPETLSNPKKIIEDALNIAQNHLPSRRNKIKISDLYQPIGQKVSIQKLQELDSFKYFSSSVEEAFKN